MEINDTDEGTDDTSQRINKYLEESEKAISKLESRLGYKIEPIDFQNALGIRLGYEAENSTQVINHNLAAPYMVFLLNDYPFPELVGTIDFEDSILVAGVAGRIDEQRIKNNGEVWEIHKNDKDPFPSNPHAHNRATGYKLHLGSGELYSHNNRPLGKKIQKKDLEAIRAKVKGLTLPELTV